MHCWARQAWATHFRGITAGAGVLALQWHPSQRLTKAESYRSPDFVAREVEFPHAPLPWRPADGDTFAVCELGYVVHQRFGQLYPPLSYAPHPVHQGFVHSGKELQDFRDKVELKGDDIIVATYPKCGTTWIQQVVLLLLVGGDKSKIKNWFTFEKTSPSPYIEGVFANGDEVNAYQPPAGFARRVLKTHATAGEVPWRNAATPAGVPQGAKVIVVTRNPGDAAVSMYHHAIDLLPVFKYAGDLAHFVGELWLQGNVESGDFWAWHASWHAAQRALPADTLLLLRFEDMLEDPEKAIRQIAAFCGLSCDNATIERTVHAASFKEMKTQFKEQVEERKAQGLPVKADHMRRGKKGSWRDELSPELAARLCKVHERRCQEEGLPADMFRF